MDPVVSPAPAPVSLAADTPFAAIYAGAAEVFPLWRGRLPGGGTREPLAAWYPAAGSHPGIRPGMALVILPGGGYRNLAAHEGAGYARFLAARGVSCLVVGYRMSADDVRHPVPLLDAAEGVRLLRSEAAARGIDPARVGIMGSSAGGHLAATLLTSSDYENGGPGGIPDFGVLCYPVIALEGPAAHQGSATNLLGEHPAEGAREAMSAHARVSASTPPCFLWHTCQDMAVPVENSLLFASALARAGVRVELQVYPEGNHGLGLGPKARDGVGEPLPWAHALLRWLGES